MTISLPRRVPENAPGDFYVEAGLCTRCCLPHGEAPDLLNDPEQPFEECYFRRQPQSDKEDDQAVNAICVSEMCALRYGGSDLAIIAKLRERNAIAQCDQTPEGQAQINQVRRVLEYEPIPQTRVSLVDKALTFILGWVCGLVGFILVMTHVHWLFGYARTEGVEIFIAAVLGVFLCFCSFLFGRRWNKKFRHPE